MNNNREINILIIEDDEDINNLLRDILEAEGFNIYQAFSGTEGSLVHRLKEPDLIILDLMMPGLNGEEVLQAIRLLDNLPVIVVSAKMDTETKVDLLNLGADDFIEKPFRIEEVVARVNAQLRRYLDFSTPRDLEKDGKKVHKNLVLDHNQRKILVNNKPLKLTVKEYDILKLLMDYPKKVFTKANIYQAVWGEDAFMDDNTLNVHISNLRNKIFSLDTKEEYIETVWGIGFKLKN